MTQPLDLARTAAEPGNACTEPGTEGGTDKMQATRSTVSAVAIGNDPRSRDRMTCSPIIRPSQRFGEEA